MALRQKCELSLAAFINIIESLELGGFIYHYKRAASTKNQYKQLPRNLTLAFKYLDNIVKNNHLNIIDPNDVLDDFLNTLVNCCLANYFLGRNSERQHAEYLLGFLLHNNVHLKSKGVSRSLADLIDAKLPRYHRIVIQGLRGSLPSPLFDFLSVQWRENQHYPDLNTLLAIWKKERLQHQEKQKDKILIDPSNESQSFKGLVLDFEKLSYALEGFVKTGKVELAKDDQPGTTRSTLSLEVSSLILRFSQIARSKGSASIASDTLPIAFVKMMKAIIFTAKYPNQQQFASQQLLGFMLYHNFQIRYGDQIFKISDIVNAEMTPEDSQALNLRGPQQFPFLLSDWQQIQCFPGKQDLERIISAELRNKPIVDSRPIELHQEHEASSPSFLPFYQQRAASFPAFITKLSPPEQPSTFLKENTLDSLGDGKVVKPIPKKIGETKKSDSAQASAILKKLQDEFNKANPLYNPAKRITVKPRAILS